LKCIGNTVLLQSAPEEKISKTTDDQLLLRDTQAILKHQGTSPQEELLHF
jgi:hypothetical protein